MTNKIHYRTCNLCEAMCGIEIHMNADKIKSIRGDKKDPFSKGYICPKATALQDVYEDPDRLREPVKRTKDGWEKITWKQAFSEVASNIHLVQKAHGKDAVAFYLGNPTVHNYGSILSVLLTNSLKTKNHYSASSVDQLPHHLVGLKMFGHSLILPIPDVDRTNFFLIIGGNPAVSNGSLMSAAGIVKRMKNIQKNSGKIVVVDPIYTRTAELADQHYFIRPSNDIFLLLAMLHVIFANNWDCCDSLPSFYKNQELLRDLVADYSPEKIEQMVGITAVNIRKLTAEFCEAKSAVCYGRLGVSVQEFGTITQWLITVLNIITGNFDCAGGAMFSKPAFDLVQFTAIGEFGRWKSRVRQLPVFNGEVPVATLADEMLTSGEGQIKAFVTIAGNPVLSTPNGKKLQRAINSLDYMVSVDFYINETTCNANIILPPTHALEHDNYDFIFLLLAVQNFAKYSPSLYPKPKNMLHDWEIFRELHIHILSKSTCGKLKALLLRFMYVVISPLKIISLGLRLGPYGNFFTGLTLKKVKKSPHGIDLGALKASFPERLKTKDKKVDMAPDIFVKDLKRVAKKIIKKETDNFLLIGRRNLRSNNSWMHNCKRLIKGANQCTMWMHSNDAKKLNLKNGDFVNVISRVGKITINVEISENIMPGVVSIPHGWGHDYKETKMRIAKEHPGINVNILTDEKSLDLLSGNAILNGVPVTLEKI